MVELDNNQVQKKNNLNTKPLPPLFMLVAGLISFIISLVYEYDTYKMLLVVFLSMLIFTILGTIVKSIVDSFNMKMSYDDLFDDEGEIIEK